MDNSERFYSWSLITYSTPLEFMKLFDKANHYAYILHDKEKATNHYHILVTFKREISLLNIRKIIDSEQNTLGQPLRDKYSMFLYLTHENLQAEEKAVYEKEAIISNDYKFWQTVQSDKSEENKQFLIDLIKLDRVNLFIKYGRDYARNRVAYESFVHDLYSYEATREHLESLLSESNV